MCSGPSASRTDRREFLKVAGAGFIYTGLSGQLVPFMAGPFGAAETTGRVCFGIELNPAYVDVAIERWQQFTGANAVLAETGETFADLKTKRLAA